MKKLKSLKYENIYLLLLMIYSIGYIKANIYNLVDLLIRVLFFGGLYIVIKEIRLENKKSVNAKPEQLKR